MQNKKTNVIKDNYIIILARDQQELKINLRKIGGISITDKKIKDALSQN